MGCSDCGNAEIDLSHRLVQARRDFSRIVHGIQYRFKKGEQQCIPFSSYALLTLFLKEISKCESDV